MWGNVKRMLVKEIIWKLGNGDAKSSQSCHIAVPAARSIWERSEEGHVVVGHLRGSHATEESGF